jgi:hypothetical protein
MELTQLPHRIEILFWMAAINMMEESAGLVWLVREAYTIQRSVRSLSFLKLSLIFSLSGLVLGFVLGIVMTAVH